MHTLCTLRTPGGAHLLVYLCGPPKLFYSNRPIGLTLIQVDWTITLTSHSIRMD